MKDLAIGGAVLLLELVCGCASTTTSSPLPNSDSALTTSVPGDVATELAPAGSLFKEDQAAISNEDMAKVLEQEIRLPARAKLAVVRFGRLPYWWGWSESFVRMNEKIDADFLQRLSSSPRIRDVSYLPSMVTPADMTVSHLRQAAARFQADMLLVYRTDSRSYDREKLFRPGETKAYCTVEAVLIDTRTGLIPFSTVVTEKFSATRQPQDIDFNETIAKANQQAIANAWLRVADEVSGYFKNLSQ